MSQKVINLYEDTVIKLTVKQGTEVERQLADLEPGELGFTRDTERLFVGTTDKSENHRHGILTGNRYFGNISSSDIDTYGPNDVLSSKALVTYYPSYNKTYNFYDGDFALDKTKNAFILFDNSITQESAPNKLSSSSPKIDPAVGRAFEENIYENGRVLFYNFLPDNKTIICDSNSDYNILKIGKIDISSISPLFDGSQFTAAGGTIKLTLKAQSDIAGKNVSFSFDNIIDSGSYITYLLAEKNEQGTLDSFTVKSSNITLAELNSFKTVSNIFLGIDNNPDENNKNIIKNNIKDLINDEFCTKADLKNELNKIQTNNNTSTGTTVNFGSSYVGFPNFAMTATINSDGIIDYNTIYDNFVVYARGLVPSEDNKASLISSENGNTAALENDIIIKTQTDIKVYENSTNNPIIKSGSTIKAGSYINGEVKATDTTTTTDTNITNSGKTLLLPGTIIKKGSTFTSEQIDLIGNINFEFSYIVNAKDENDNPVGKKLINDVYLLDYAYIKSNSKIAKDSRVVTGVTAVEVSDSGDNFISVDKATIVETSYNEEKTSTKDIVAWPYSILKAGTVLANDSAYNDLNENVNTEFYIHIKPDSEKTATLNYTYDKNNSEYTLKFDKEALLPFKLSANYEKITLTNASNSKIIAMK